VLVVVVVPPVPLLQPAVVVMTVPVASFLWWVVAVHWMHAQDPWVLAFSERSIGVPVRVMEVLVCHR